MDWTPVFAATSVHIDQVHMRNMLCVWDAQRFLVLHVTQRKTLGGGCWNISGVFSSLGSDLRQEPLNHGLLVGRLRYNPSATKKSTFQHRGTREERLISWVPCLGLRCLGVELRGSVDCGRVSREVFFVLHETGLEHMVRPQPKAGLLQNTLQEAKLMPLSVSQQMKDCTL